MSDSDVIQDASRNAFRSARLIYRAIEDNDEDLTFFRDSIANDPLVRAPWNNSLLRPQSKAMATELFHEIRNATLGVFICLPSTSEADAEGGEQLDTAKPIGFVILRTQGPEHVQHRASLLAIALSVPYQGKGYGPEAINWALDWAFRFGNLHRVGLDVFAFNHRALRVYERLGFVREGVIREVIWFDRRWHDLVQYGMLDSDWERLRHADSKRT